MRNKQRPWIPESSGERRETPAIGYASPFDLALWERENKKREENERVLHPNDGYYRDRNGNLCKVTSYPYVNGRHWERLQKRGDY